ncbi:aTP-dependent DNA helicase RecG [Clostridium sp. CAG:594]|nr:aTP-dependent DNA helicase RecG [Clostridium sp. CAG:594]
MELEKLDKIGPKTAKTLNNLGIYSAEDLIRNYPYRFLIFAKRDINNPKYYDEFVSDGIVESMPTLNFFRGKMNRLTFRCNVQNKIVKVVIFNRAFLKPNIIIGKEVTIIGKYDPKKETIVATNIRLGNLNKVEIEPVYHLCKGITSKQMNAFIKKALSAVKENNNIPKELISKYNLMSEDEAIRIIHNPKDENSLKTALKTLKYEEIFTYMKNIKLLKKKNEIHKDVYKKEVSLNMVNDFINSLPFKLTSDQEKIVFKMLDEICGDALMNRLLQGDVGSGKTIVAFIISYALYTGGYQTSFMAPTEVLARQHYKNACDLFKDTNFKVGLLTGKMTLKEKRKVYEDIQNKKIDMLIGTHALISDKVVWNNLGLVITDEQHRFGVNQRQTLKNKGLNVEVLMMSATPIPRTYALTIYGDTDTSSIKTKPSGRIPVITKVKKEDEIKDVLEGIYKALKNQNQVYVIAPMIEENDDSNYANVYDLKHKFNLAFKNYNVEVLHGKMTNEEKEKVMDEYAKGNIDILISTTVIEVGVDVKNATVMVIFDADRFGLSTLHQLRGRVGRNSIQSYCYLISDKDTKRLKIMEEENDGYKISEADFKLRGQGDLFGSRQSGALSFKLSDVRKDYDLLVKVRDDVNELVK